MAKMTWEKIPKGTPMSLSKESVEKIHGNTTSAFLKGVAVGAIGLLILQGCEMDDAAPKDGNVKPTPSATAPRN
jgi:hypothetical protein